LANCFTSLFAVGESCAPKLCQCFTRSRLTRSDSRPPNGLNSGWYDNPKIDELLNKAIAEPNPDASAKLYRDANKQIMADAAYAILTCNSRDTTGNFFIDEEVLRQAGVTDFEQYAVTPGTHLHPDIFLG
jgi:ABC-type transport system substrate-binding protein